MGAHALLSASSAYRWMACPPSARLEEGFPDSQSEYAAEGSHAHAVAELMLTKLFTPMKPSVFKKRLAELEASQYHSPAVMEHVKVYTDFISECYNGLETPTILMEERVDFSDYVPEGFGTCDCILIGNGVMQVVDFKYGSGVPVSAENNAQMRLYALGALAAYDMVYDISTVNMTIVQPRLDSISTHEVFKESLYNWADEILKPAAELAHTGGGDFTAGDHCRFCRAKVKCRARAEANLAATRYDFEKPALLADDEIADILTIADQLKAWADDIEAYALEQARDHGKSWPGWKLVEGRSNRKYIDADAVANKLLASGIQEAIIYERSLLGITAMEKALGGKKKFEELVGDLIDKPAGKPVLVPESDKRPAINSTAAAAADFKEEA